MEELLAVHNRLEQIEGVHKLKPGSSSTKGSAYFQQFIDMSITSRILKIMDDERSLIDKFKSLGWLMTYVNFLHDEQFFEMIDRFNNGLLKD